MPTITSVICPNCKNRKLLGYCKLCAGKGSISPETFATWEAEAKKRIEREAKVDFYDARKLADSMGLLAFFLSLPIVKKFNYKHYDPEGKQVNYGR